MKFWLTAFSVMVFGSLANAEVISGDSMPDFIYDYTNGDLVFDDDGAGVIALTFNTASASTKPLATYESTLGNIESWEYNAFVGQTFFEFTDTSFGFNPATNADDYLLAELPGNLAMSDFGIVEYQIASNTDIHQASLTVVPEPASLILMSVAGVLVGRRRRLA